MFSSLVSEVWIVTTDERSGIYMYTYNVGQSISSRNSPDWNSATSDSVWSKNDHRGAGTRSWHLSRIHLCDFFFPDDLKMRLVGAILFRVVCASRYRAEPHIACCAAIPRRGKHSCHHPTTLISGSRSEWLLAVLYSENGPQGGAFRTLEDIKSNATAELRKVQKKSFRQCIQQWQDRWSNCVCVCVRACVLARFLILKAIR